MKDVIKVSHCSSCKRYWVLIDFPFKIVSCCGAQQVETQTYVSASVK